MKKLLNTKTKLIVAIVLVAILLTWLALFLFARGLALDLWRPILFTLLFVGLAWIGVHFGLKAWRTRTNKAFDEAVAAKEGIEDRKREWAAWNEELDKQGIDRYELPFYLLVGEPQSGKSVLLHNSDLHFPFGQTRLSGIGGTRGCDWWFTEEAVILDLAGRLFTHEGGAADRLEWEAFLDLLSEFRPLCPANGVMLVIPCDGLLAETADQSAAKANKIQSALLTLTSKLQAQLPVYLVLTKGDKVFGFAESVHRLEVERRHEMFGWSRPSERIEAPFDMAEVKQGFEGVVVRAELLRAQMLSTARLPEALPEIDRMYAFPEELSGVWSNLEVYLRRIFTESGLVDRLYFRGIYLTSGLQSGVPVAKVCNELFGRAGEADGRNLEALFSKQRAYFIKDLVRKRVFAERGLVRPTKGRVLKARRSAWVGYGVSAALVLLSVVFSIVYLARENKGVPQVEAYQQSLVAAERLAKATNASIPDVLSSLERARNAVDQEKSAMEAAYFSPEVKFKELYVAQFDHLLLPQIRPLILSELAKAIDKPPQSFQALQDLCGSVALLLEDVDLSDADDRELLLKWVPFAEKSSSGGGKPFELEEAFLTRIDYGDDAGLLLRTPKSDRGLLELARKAREYVDTSLDPGKPWMPDGELGYLLAWKGVHESRKAFANIRSDFTPVFEKCRQYVECLDHLKAIEERLPLGAGGKRKVDNASIWLAMRKLRSTYRDPIRNYIQASGESVPETWPVANSLMAWVKECFVGYEAGGLNISSWGANLGSEDAALMIFTKSDTAISAASSWIEVPDQRIKELEDPLELRTVCVGPLTGDWKLEGLARGIKDSLDGGYNLRSSQPQHQVFRAQSLAIQRAFLQQFRSPQDVLTALAEPAGTVLSARLVQELEPLHSAARNLGESAGEDELFRPWLERIEDLLEDHLDEARASGARVLTLEEGATTVPESIWELMASLQRVSKLVTVANEHAQLPRGAAGLRLSCLQDCQAQVFASWSEPWEDRKRMLAAVNDASSHFILLQRAFDADGLAALEKEPRELSFRGQVDDLLGSRLERFAEALVVAWGADTGAIWDSAVSPSASSTNQQMSQLRQKSKQAEDAGARDAARIVSLLGEGTLADAWLKPGGERARAAVKDLGTLGIAPENEVTNEESVVQLQRAVNTVLREPGSFETGEQQAALYRQYFTGGELPAPANGGVRYMRLLREAFRGNLLRRVQAAYALALEEALQDQRIDPAIDALYARLGDSDASYSDPLVVTGLNTLLKRAGTLDKLREAYFGGQPGSPGHKDLRPRQDEDLPPGEREWWDFEAFLGELQTFLLGPKGKSVEAAAFKVTLKPESKQKQTLWDPGYSDRGWKDNFWYPTDDRGDWKPTQVMANMKIDPLDWSLEAGDDKKLRMKWSQRNDTRSGVLTDEASLSLQGSLAPLVLAWSGERMEDDPLSWKVVLQPQQPAGDTRLTAPMTLIFEGPLPPRPIDPRAGG